MSARVKLAAARPDSSTMPATWLETVKVMRPGSLTSASLAERMAGVIASAAPLTTTAVSLATSGASFTRSEEHTSELQSLMRISYAVFCLKKKKKEQRDTEKTTELQRIYREQLTYMYIQ